MVTVRAFALPLALLSLSAFAACGGDDDDDAGSSSGTSGAADASTGASSSSSSSSSGSSSGALPADAGTDAEADGGPSAPEGILYSKGTGATVTVRYFSAADGQGATDLTPAFDPTAWSQELVVSASGSHFAYGDAAGSIFVGHAGRAQATNVTTAPKAGGADGRKDALLLEDGSLVYAGVYAEAGKVDVFRDATRLSTGAGRVDVADLSEASISLYAAGKTVAWSLQSDDPLGTYVKWNDAAAEVAVPEATVIDSISPSESCLTYYPDENSTTLLCNGAAALDLDSLSNTPIGSVESHWVQSGAKLVTFRPQGGNDPVYVVAREGATWTATPSGAFTDTGFLGSAPAGTRLAFDDGDAPLHLLDVTAAPQVVTPAIDDILFDPTGAALSPDGSAAVVWSNDTIYLATASGAVEVPVEIGAFVAGAAWSPDGTRFVVAESVFGTGGRVVVVDLANTPVEIDSASLRQVRWASNGTLALVDDDGNLTVVAADGSVAANPAPIDTAVDQLFGSIEITPST